MLGEHTATKEAKYSFQTLGKPLTPEALLEHIAQRAHMFPHADGSIRLVGELGKTGMVALNGHDNVVAAVRASNSIPTQLVKGGVEFGGVQTEDHIEKTLERPVAPEFTMRSAKAVLRYLDEAPFPEVSANFTGLGAIGSEPEGVLIGPDGNLVPLPGGELQLGCIEESIPAIADSREFLAARATQILERKAAAPSDSTVIDSSVSITSAPQRMRVANTGELGPYVEAVQHLLYERYMNCADPIAKAVMDKIARSHGFEGFDHMKKDLGNMAFWCMFASHASVGLHHRRTGNEGRWVPDKEAIYIADIFNSNLGTLAEMLMMSTPVVYGMTPTVEGAWPRDYRTILKYVLDTAFPAEFIRDSRTMNERITHGIVNGLCHTMDRCSYLADVNGRLVPSMHGRVRNRKATSEPKNQTGRVEFTGCPSSPSIYDELGRNSFLQVLTIGAYEALAANTHPAEFYAARFPNISRWQEQKDLAIAASVHGFRSGAVESLIREGIEFTEYIGHKYEGMQEKCAEAKARLSNLLVNPVDNLLEYVDNPQGPFCEVAQAEYAYDPDPMRLAKKMEEYQLTSAARILSS